jgi:oxygen-independent coproporphyrinogen-3 oxidase
VTLEGVPAAFLNRRPRLAEVVREELPARQIRLSMGIQTFDPDRLRQMGRLGFGDAGTFGEVVAFGHARGFTVSGDLLFNLPGQSLDAMKDDVRRAVDLGLDHLGLYHLVMFAGLGTAWSQDPALLAALPTNEEAAANWLELKGLLEGLGFDQTTLTNFERREFRGDDRRFVYEEFSFLPDAFEMLGFGPSAISYAGGSINAGAGSTAVKVLNPDGASAYVNAIQRGGPAWDRAFAYSPRDLRILHLTRRLAALRIERQDYHDAYGTDPLDDFPREFAALRRGGLIEVDDETIRPTAPGIFYADSIAGLLAWRRSGLENDNARGHM